MNHQPDSLASLSPQDLLVFGLQDVAYLRPTESEAGPGVEIHAADGTQMAVVPNRAVAVALVRQHGLEPLSLH